jgi:hypothetical protein
MRYLILQFFFFLLYISYLMTNHIMNASLYLGSYLVHWFVRSCVRAFLTSI